MTDKKNDFVELNKTLERWKETNYFKTRIEEEFDSRLQEMVNNKKEIKNLKTAQEKALNQQQATFKLALANVGDLMQYKLHNPVTADKTGLKLSELIDDFFSLESLSIRNNKEATIRKDRDSLKLFIEIVGDKYISEVSQLDAVKFAKAVPLHGRQNGVLRAVNTVNGFMNTVSKFSGWIASYHSETGHIKLNFSNLHRTNNKRPSEEREEFSDNEVVRILTHPQMTLFKSEEPIKFWLLFIAAYSGARLEEIAQLSPTTDIYESDGVWIIDINDRDGRSVKTRQSIRKIPIHSELINQGFLTYALRMKLEKAETLFPNERKRDGRTGKNAGKRVNRFIQKTIGIKNKSLHSFRHTFATKLKRTSVNEGVAAAIMGQEFGGITYNRYGKDYLSATLAKGVEMVSFEFEN